MMKTSDEAPIGTRKTNANLNRARSTRSKKPNSLRRLRSKLVPRRNVTDQLRSYPAAKADIPELAHVKRARMEGFVIFDHTDSYDAAYKDLEAWVRSGQIRYIEDVLVGIERAPDAVAGLYRGENMGKRLIQLTAV